MIIFPINFFKFNFSEKNISDQICLKYILDSELRGDCIDFTMCFFIYKLYYLIYIIINNILFEIFIPVHYLIQQLIYYSDMLDNILFRYV